MKVVVVGALTFLGITGAAAAQFREDTRTLNECLALDDESKVKDCAQSYRGRACLHPFAQDRQPAARSEWNACVAAGISRTSTPQQEVDNVNKCARLKSEHDTASQQSASDRLQQCAQDVHARTNARIESHKTCQETGQLSACLKLDDPSLQKHCLTRCMDVRLHAVEQMPEQAQGECEASFIEARGKGKFTCRFEGDSQPARDSKVTQEELGAALQTRDGPAIDRAMHELELSLARSFEPECTKRCKERAPQLMAADSKAEGLVISYKKCMVAADSTHEARKLAVYEPDLYCNLIQKSDTKCRAASRCDWLEEYSALQCTSASESVAGCLEQ